jgi:hypothetical protein
MLASTAADAVLVKSATTFSKSSGDVRYGIGSSNTVATDGKSDLRL